MAAEAEGGGHQVSGLAIWRALFPETGLAVGWWWERWCLGPLRERSSVPGVRESEGTSGLGEGFSMDTITQGTVRAQDGAEEAHHGGEGDREGMVREAGEDQRTRREQCPKIQEQHYEKAEVTNVPCCRRPVMVCQGPFQWHHGVRAGF